MTTIAVDESTAAVLEQMRAEAEARRQPLYAYLLSLRATAPSQPPSTTPTLTTDQFRALLDELERGERATGSIPADFSREDIYLDHD